MFLSWKAFFVSPLVCSPFAFISGVNVSTICKSFRYKYPDAELSVSDESIAVLLRAVPWTFVHRHLFHVFTLVELGQGFPGVSHKCNIGSWL